MLIREITLNTNLLNELKNFYSDILELGLIHESQYSFTVKTLNSDITFLKSSLENPFYHFAFNIPENQIKQAKEWALQRFKLISLNGEDEFDFLSWNAHSIYFYDPAGNILEFIARHNLNNKSDTDFSGKSILNVSEIGLPVVDVKIFYETINKNFNIPVFSGDMKTFTAAGDDDGLMIIVPENRNWFPDCPPAKIFPLTIELISDTNKQIKFEKIPYTVISFKH